MDPRTPPVAAHYILYIMLVLRVSIARNTECVAAYALCVPEMRDSHGTKIGQASLTEKGSPGHQEYLCRCPDALEGKIGRPPCLFLAGPWREPG